MSATLRRLARLERDLAKSLALVQEQIAAEKERLVAEAERQTGEREARQRFQREKAKLARDRARLDAELASLRSGDHRQSPKRKAVDAEKRRLERAANLEAERAHACALARRAAGLVAAEASRMQRRPIDPDQILRPRVRGVRAARSALISICIDRVGLTQAEVARALMSSTSNIHSRYNYGLTVEAAAIYDAVMAKIDEGAMTEAA